MHKNYCLNRSFFLLVIPLLLGCTASKPKVAEEQMIGMLDLSSYHVEDRSNSLVLPVADVLVDLQSGMINYIAVEAPLSGFNLDIRTAPYQSNQVILIPWQLAHLEMEKEQLRLQVGVHELMNAPRFSPPIDTFPNNWRDTVERYWNSYTGGRE